MDETKSDSKSNTVRYLNIFSFTLGLLELLITITLAILDGIYFVNITNSVTFAKQEIFSNGGANVHSMLLAYFVMGIIICFFNTYKFVNQVIVHCARDKYTGTVKIVIGHACVFILIDITRHVLFYFVINCLNGYFQTMIKARCLLAIILMISYLVSFSLYIYHRRIEPKVDRRLDIIRLVSIVVCFLICFGIIGVNVLVIQTLKSGDESSVQLKDINVDLFTHQDVENIRNGNYIKDKYFQYRMLATLNSIVYSTNKRLAYNTCTRLNSRRCTTYYFRRWIVDIPCTYENSQFYTDCKNSTDTASIRFKFEYLDDEQDYPRYSCGILSKNGRCYQGCSIISQYMVVMTQEKSNGTELAWKNFGKCTRQPKSNLYYEYDIDTCFGMSIFKLNWFTYFISYFLLYLTY